MLSATNAYYNWFFANGLAEGRVIPFDGVVTGFTYIYQGSEATASIDSASAPGTLDYPFNFFFYTISSQFFASAGTLKDSGCPKNCVGDPINPVNGNLYKAEQDMAASGQALSSFSRAYNSMDFTNDDLSPAWRHSFSRAVKAKPAATVPYAASDPNNSPLYDDEASACISGFAQIQSRVANWAGATASYSNGLCLLTKSGVNIGMLPIYPSNLSYPLSSQTISYDVTRDDGQLIRFTLLDGVITAPPGIALKLQQTASGYTLTDASDTIETYDSSGMLQTTTTRANVVQTISYDTNGRLSMVADSFGHKLTLGYDTQNRVISVTRQ